MCHVSLILWQRLISYVQVVVSSRKCIAITRYVDRIDGSSHGLRPEQSHPPQTFCRRALYEPFSQVIAFKALQITSLALKLCAQSPSQWPDWLESSIQGLSTRGASTESLLDYLAIVAEEIDGADLVGAHR